MSRKRTKTLSSQRSDFGDDLWLKCTGTPVPWVKDPEVIDVSPEISRWLDENPGSHPDAWATVGETIIDRLRAERGLPPLFSKEAHEAFLAKWEKALKP